VLQVARSTPHRFAAASTSIARAAAPAARNGAQLPPTLQLPPVPRRLKFGPGEACTTAIVDQSASSSSARIMASDVRTPCPISDFPMVRMVLPLGSIRIQPFGTNDADGLSTAKRSPSQRTPMTSAPPASAVVPRNARRVSVMTSSSRRRGG
jgi:hypothetical protein